MNVLVIYSHPQRESLNGALLDQILRSLERRPDAPQVEVLDLYQDNFNPVLNFGPENRRRDMHKDPDTQVYREKILWAQKIIFVYPIWWGRPPAMLLGFIDRLFASEFAYRDKKGALLPEGLLGGREVVCVSTMKGPPGYLQLWLWNAHRVLMKKALFNYVGIKKVKFFELGGMEGKEKRRLQALEKIGAFFLKPAF